MTQAVDALFARPIAHRGRHACGAPGPIENSISAALAAIGEGWAIECDVQLSADGEVIVFHDETLDRLTEECGRLDARAAADLGQVRLKGSVDHIPTLRRFLDAVDGRVPLVIEIKSDGSGDPTLADRAEVLLRDYRGCAGLESFDARIVARLLDRDIRRPIGLVGPQEDGGIVDPDLIASCDFISWNIWHLAEAAVRYPRARRTSWTVRTPDQATLAASLGAQIVFEGFTPKAY